MSKQAVIQVNNVRKSYGSTKAVDGVSFTVKRQEIFGVIGANGAGKTTTLEMMMGLRKPDQGEIHVLGYNVVQKSGIKSNSNIGIQLQQTSLYDRIKVEEALELFCFYYEKTRDRQEIIDLLGLRTLILNKYRKEAFWRLATANSLGSWLLINDPEIIFLDEPTTGLDPQARRDLWNIILMLRDEGKDDCSFDTLYGRSTASLRSGRYN